MVAEFLREDGSSGTYGLVKLGRSARAAVPALRGSHRPSALGTDWRGGRPYGDRAPGSGRGSGADRRPGPIREEASEVPEALGRLGPDASAALRALIGLVTKGEAWSAAVEALVRIDPEGKVCVPALIEALKSDDSLTVDTAALALRTLGPRAKEAIPALVATLTRKFKGGFEDERNPVADSMKALGRVGPEARSAIPALIRALKPRREVPAVRGGDFGNEEKEIDYEAAIVAAQVLAVFGPEAKGAVPALIEVLQAHDDNNDAGCWQARREAALAVWGGSGRTRGWPFRCFEKCWRRGLPRTPK